MTGVGLSAIELTVLMVATFVAAAVRGYTGFGLSAIVITSASILIPPARLVPILYILEIVASIHMLRSVWSDIDRTTLVFILAGCVLGMPVGQYLLTHLPVDVTRILLYTMVLLAAALIWGGYQLQHKVDCQRAFVTGLVTGLAGGIAAIGGLVTMIILLGSRYDVVRARATLVALFPVFYAYGTGVAVLNDLIDVRTFQAVLALLVPLFAGIIIGQKKFLKGSTEVFRRFALILLIILAMVGILGVILA